jgi:leucyl aminopeptidase
MNIVVRKIKETEILTDALILPLCEGEGTGPYAWLDALLKKRISGVISSGEFEGKKNQFALIHSMDAIKPKRVALIGLGKRGEVTPERLRQAGGKAISSLQGLGLKDVSLSTASVISLNHSPVPLIEGGLLSLYTFNKYRKGKDIAKVLERITVIATQGKALNDEIRWVKTTSSAVNFVRDLVNTPSNDMTPSVLAQKARAIAGGRVSVKILDRKTAEQEGMGAFLSVSKGSQEPPRFIVLRYNGGRGAPLALIGKSITFDSGGISLKPGEGMEKMKYDMAGGAVVLAVIRTASEMKLPVNLLGVLPAAENLPSGSASKPGDVVGTVTGKTIEIINTDAEGRLALADAIGYVKKFKPKGIIDIATLTGACPVALGNEAIAMMGNSTEIMNTLKSIGDELYERVWQMPLYDEYLEYIKSDVADLKNSGGKTGSLVTSGYFLKEFAGDTPWVHLDIAGTAWTEKDKPYTPKGATGIGVRLLTTFIKGMK